MIIDVILGYVIENSRRKALAIKKNGGWGFKPMRDVEILLNYPEG